MYKNIVVNALSLARHPNCATFVRLSRIIERPPTRVFHSCLPPSTVFNESAASFMNLEASSPPSRLGHLVQKICCSCFLCRWVSHPTSRDLLSNASSPTCFLSFIHFPINSNIHLEWCPNTSTPEICCQRLPFPPLLFRANQLTLPEYSQTTASCAERRRTAHA